MSNNAQLLLLPDEVQAFVHCQGMGGMIVEGPQYHAVCEWITNALACIEAAKPADALGSLPVVADLSINRQAGFDLLLTARNAGKCLKDGHYELTDHAQATAEISKRDAEIERLNGRCMYWAGQFEAEQGKRIEAHDRHRAELTTLRAEIDRLKDVA